MKYTDGSTAEYGDVIRWKIWDNEDFVTWTFTGLYTRKGVVYLGGGFDFGMGIGEIYTPEEVMADASNNDPDDRGIEKVGKASEMADYIGMFSR